MYQFAERFMLANRKPFIEPSVELKGARVTHTNEIKSGNLVFSSSGIFCLCLRAARRALPNVRVSVMWHSAFSVVADTRDLALAHQHIVYFTDWNDPNDGYIGWLAVRFRQPTKIQCLDNVFITQTSCSKSREWKIPNQLTLTVFCRYVECVHSNIAAAVLCDRGNLKAKPSNARRFFVARLHSRKWAQAMSLI